MTDLQKTLRVIKGAGGWTAAEMAEQLASETGIEVQPMTFQRWLDGVRAPSAPTRPAVIKWADGIAQEMGISVDPARA